MIHGGLREDQTSSRLVDCNQRIINVTLYYITETKSSEDFSAKATIKMNRTCNSKRDNDTIQMLTTTSLQ